MHTTIAQAFGFIGLILAVISFQGKTRKQILFFQMLCGFAFTIHFIMLGAYTGAILNALSSLRSIVYFYQHKPWGKSRLWPLAFALMCIVLAVFTWEGIITLLPVTSYLVYTFSFRVQRPATVRKYIWIGSPLWIVYNVINKSYGGVLTEMFNLASIFLAIYRYDIRKPEKEQRAV